MTDKYAIGPSVVGLVTFKALGGALVKVPHPKGFFQPYAELRPLASGGVRGVGFPIARMHWDFMRVAWYDSIRDILTAISGDCYICTRTNEDTDAFDYFTAKYQIPNELELDTHRRMDFDIIFTHLVPSSHPA
jgi:hypothetical protein